MDPSGCWLQGSQSLTVTTGLPVGAYTLWVLAWSPSASAWSTAVSFRQSRFEDRGQTIFDNQTGLEWEKKTNDGSIHDLSNQYTWSTGTNNPDGTAFTVFLAGLNAGPCVTESADGATVSSNTGCPGAGHNDWRLPTASELKTICSTVFCFDPIFGPTQTSLYWSSSSAAGNPQLAWFVNFLDGGSNAFRKTDSFYVRAVRGEGTAGVTGGGCTRNVGGTIVILPGCR